MSVEAWTSAVFVDEARGWVADRLERVGASLTGDWAQPHARPWSSTMWFATTAGRVWFKVNAPASRYEPALLGLLAERVPGLAPEVVAMDQERGWSLLRDGGPPLRSVLAPQDSWAVWEGLVATYAAAQVRLTTDRVAVLSTGAAEVSPTTLPGLARELVVELAAQPVQQGGLGAAEADRLAAALPRFDAWCAELGASAVPDSIQHDDLHSGNVCWRGSVPEARIIDWGDAVWGAPLGTLLCTTASLAHHAGLPADAPEVLRVRDAYLEPFTEYVDRAALLRLADLSCRTGRVTRALSWRAALRGAPLSEHVGRELPVRGWLLELLEL